MINIRGKWALITGASRGIGRLAALCLAEQGANIVALCRDVAHMHAVTPELEQWGITVHSIAVDLSDPASVESALQEVDSLGVKIEIVLNNAGVQVAYRTDYYSTPVADYTESFAINTIAPMMICYHYLPRMIADGFGRIINTTSGIREEPEQAGYSASKAALDKVTTDLGSKLQGTDVIISLTDPGWCRTDLGGPNAPNAPESAVPGVVVGVFVNDGISGRWFSAQDFAGLSLEDAVKKAESIR